MTEGHFKTTSKSRHPETISSWRSQVDLTRSSQGHGHSKHAIMALSTGITVPVYKYARSFNNVEFLL